MYKLTLSTSHFPAQGDADILDMTISRLLRQVATAHPGAVAIVDVDDSGKVQKFAIRDSFLAGNYGEAIDGDQS